MARNWILAAGAAALAMGSAASAAIYVKIPPIDGESANATPGVEPDEIDVKVAGAAAARGKDSGEAHLDYLVITMNNAQENRTTPFETENIGVNAPDAGSTAGHEVTHVVQQRGDRRAENADKEHEGWIDVLSWSQPITAAATAPAPARQGSRNVIRARTVTTAVAPRDAASGMASGKRQHRPVTMTKPIDKASPLMVPVEAGPGSLRLAQSMDGCRVGARYGHILVGDDAVGREVKLEDVTVAECSGEHVSFNYQKVSS